MAKKVKKPEVPPVWSQEFQWFIPRLGTCVRLEQDWRFRLQNEYRNNAVCELFGLKIREGRCGPGKGHELTDSTEPMPYGCWIWVRLFKGTVLRVNRIYIKPESSPDSSGLNQGGEYNSITFTIDHAPDDLVMIDCLSGSKLALRDEKTGKPKRPRFWAKLKDVNDMHCVVDMNTLAKF